MINRLRISVFCIALFAVALFTPTRFPTVQAETELKTRTISVTGEAQINVVPDQVILTLGIETLDKTLKTAKGQNDERISQILTLAKSFNIPPEKVKTDYISIQPRYNDNYSQKDFIGFLVRKNVVLTLNDLSKFEDLLSAVLDSGANYVFGVDFRTTELRKYRDQARDAAIKAAREKAEAMAATLGLKVGKPVSVSEDTFGWGYYGGPWSGSGGPMTQNVIQNAPAGSSTSAGEATAPGQIAVTAKVSIVFDLSE